MGRLIATLIVLLLTAACVHWNQIKSDIDFSQKMSDQDCIASAVRAAPDVSLLRQSFYRQRQCTDEKCEEKVWTTSYRPTQASATVSADVRIIQLKNGEWRIENFAKSLHDDFSADDKPLLEKAVRAVGASISNHCG